MKRYGNLKNRVLDLNNLYKAFHQAARGKRDRKEVKIFQGDLRDNLLNLRQDLFTGRLKFGDYRFFTVHDPKVRQICAAAFRERVAHHALINVAGPILDSTQINHSYACQQGKGQHRAQIQAAKWACNKDFYLKMDISKYFDSIDHQKVGEMLASRFKDRFVLDIFSRIVASYESSPGRGLPLGNLTSQYLANFYLSVFDHWIKEGRGQKYYIRYMDDMLIFGDKKELLDLRTKSAQFLENELGLELKSGGQVNRTSKGVGFLGSVVYPGRIRLSKPGKKRVRARLKNYEKKFQIGLWSPQELQDRVQGLWAGMMHTSSQGWRSRVARNCLDA